MDVRQLGAVVAVVEHGTVTAAAEALHVSQPALSQTVRSLEAELGTPLFHRIGRRLVLTPAGEELVGPARQVLRDVDTVRARVEAVAGLRRGHLELVSLPTLAVDPASTLIGRFRADHPAVTVRLAEPENTADLVAMVGDGTCEVGISDVEEVPDGLVAVHLSEQEFRAVCPPGTRFGGRRDRRRVTMADLAGLAIVATPVGTSTRRLVDQAFAEVDVEPVVAVETAQREALLPLVLAGAGATLLPAPLAAEAARRGAVVVDVDPPVTRTVALLHRDGPLSPAAATFVALAAPSA